MPIPKEIFTQVTTSCRLYQATLVAVSKTRSNAELMELYALGQRIFAENRVQELTAKAPLLPKDIEWHLIGHLQTNKVRAVLPYVHCIQSLDRESLWAKLEEEASRMDLKIQCLLQIKVAAEESKYGWDYDALRTLLDAGKQNHWSHVKVEGVMGMATLTDNQQQVRSEMQLLKRYFDALKRDYFAADPDFRHLSMGMSGDYQIALEEGSTMVRIGSLLFNT